MPKLMGKKDWMQTMAEVGSAESVWYENVSVDGGKSRKTDVESTVRIGSKKGVWRIPTEEEDREMDEEIAASFDLDGVI